MQCKSGIIFITESQLLSLSTNPNYTILPPQISGENQISVEKMKGTFWGLMKIETL